MSDKLPALTADQKKELMLQLMNESWNMQMALQATGLARGYDANKYWDIIDTLLQDSYILTNSWERYRDSKVVLETLKLMLQLNKVKEVQNVQQTNVIFNNIPNKDKPLQY